MIKQINTSNDIISSVKEFEKATGLAPEFILINPEKLEEIKSDKNVVVKEPKAARIRQRLCHRETTWSIELVRTDDIGKDYIMFNSIDLNET